MVSGRRYRVLIIDKDTTVVSGLSHALENVGIQVDVDFRPYSDLSKPYGGCDLPPSSELDSYDVVLLEIEPYVPNPLNSTKDQMLLWSDVLTYMRKNAPWLPVIAHSDIVAEPFNAIFAAGTDGIFSKKLHGQTLFRIDVWEAIVDRAIYLRRLGTLGAIGLASNAIDIQLQDDFADSLGQELSVFKRLVSVTFPFATKVVLPKLTPGYSGAMVFRAIVESDTGVGHWLLKVSRSPSKLQKEIDAHLKMMRAGHEFARAVPLLWRGVVREGSFAAIVYKFAENTQEAAAKVNPSTPDVVIAELIPLLHHFYGATVKESTTLLSSVAARWAPPAEALKSVAHEVPSDTGKLLQAFAERTQDATLGRAVKLRVVFLHGDLHLSNVMLGDYNVLIDFANSDYGPMAVDAAKIVSDLLIRLPGMRGDALPEWSAAGHPLEATLKHLRSVYTLSADDVLAFSLFLKLFLCIALTYPNVDDDCKTWIRKYV